MVKCEECNQEMIRHFINKSCTFTHIKINGEVYDRDTTYYDTNKQCHDCGIVNAKGNVHHFGCDVERCPICKGQLISCGCIYKGVELLKKKG